eukprot:CAMPEP_0170170358 /NCGR_PEP_ID=MMETSP0040_2-20121228/3346_1 /TAXON_ID=641309 /ORGANISM="Lotharella oceanica, Strain CCMP622" /LENGTH=267 /DNA_ID=CAMNT_0010409717 /DNA_START=69 /DNA_END=869 /DNA_ORIENTATION=-
MTTVPRANIGARQCSAPGRLNSSKHPDGKSYKPPLGGVDAKLQMPSFLTPVRSAPVGPLRNMYLQDKPVYRSINVPRGNTSGGLMEDLGFRAEVMTSEYVAASPLPLFYEKGTSFSSKRPLTEIYTLIREAIRVKSNARVLAQPGKARLKVTMDLARDDVLRFYVNVFSIMTAGVLSGHMIEFQRRCGDSCAFWWQYQGVLRALSPHFAGAAALVKNVDNVDAPTFHFSGHGDSNFHGEREGFKVDVEENPSFLIPTEVKEGVKFAW